MSDFANIGLGSIDRSRSHWVKAKGFPDNMELELEATYAGGYRRMSLSRGGDAGADPRGITLVLHFSIMKAPEIGLPSPDRRRPRRPLPERDQGLRHHRPRLELRPLHQPLAAREVRLPGQALAARRSRSSGTSRTPSRSSIAPTSRRGSASGTRRSRRSASGTRSPSAGRNPAATTSTPRTPTTARSAGSPAT